MDERTSGSAGRVVVGPALGAVLAGAIAWLSLEVTGLGALGIALITALGSIAGWGTQNILERAHAPWAGVSAVLGVAGIGLTVLIALLIPAAPAEPETNDLSQPQSTGPLVIPDRTMSFTATPGDRARDDIDGLTGIAMVTYGDPQRLAIRHMDYDSAPDGLEQTSVHAFTGETALSLAKSEWEWFAAGNSGDLHTESKAWGGVRCALHDQDSGVTRAECWRWDERLAVAVSGLAFATGTENTVASAVEDLFIQVAKSY